MEKTIKFNDIVAFVTEAINNKLIISTLYRDYEYAEEYSITIENNKKIINFRIEEGNVLYISAELYSFISSDKIEIELTEEEKLKFKVLVLDAQKYSKGITLQKFVNFFEKSSKPTDINDLDNEDD